MKMNIKDSAGSTRITKLKKKSEAGVTGGDGGC